MNGKKKIIVIATSIVLAVVLLVTFVVMSQSKGPVDLSGYDTVLTVKVFDGGYGTGWIRQIAKKYTEKNPKVYVDVKSFTDCSKWPNEVKSDASNVDIYFSSSPGSDLALTSCKINGVDYPSYLADLTDMYNSKVPGENVLYKDKMKKSYNDEMNFDPASESGRYYLTSWADGMLGIVVNMDAWNQNGLGDLPKTTDELFEKCETITDKNKSKSAGEKQYPFVYSLKRSYWSYMFVNWSYQYMGEAEVEAYRNGYDPTGKRFTKNLITYDGFLEALKVIEKCIDTKNKGTENAYSYSSGYSQSIDFTTSQFYLLNGTGIMQPNGDWLITEMAANYSDSDKLNVRFMKTPVISSIINRCDSIENDEELSALISAIDANETSLSGTGYSVSQEDYDRVAYARNMAVTSGNCMGTYIPVYSKNVSAAKEFLLYMATDEALDIYYRETMGCTLPFERDYSGVDYTSQLSIFIRSENELKKNCSMQMYTLGGSYKYKMFALAGLNPLANPYSSGKAETYLSASELRDYKSAETLFEENYRYVSNNWGTAYQAYSFVD